MNVIIIISNEKEVVMKKVLLSFLCLSALFLTGCTDKKEVKTHLQEIIERGYIIAAVKTDSKPFGFINKKTGENEGFDIDIAKIIANDILGSERKIKFVPVTTSQKIEAITSGQVDIVIATFTITPQRQYLVDFSKPYYIAGQSVVVKNNSDIYNFSDLKNKKTIVVLGSTAEQNIRRILPMARLSGYKNYEEAFAALKSGQADALSTDNTIISGFLMDNKGYRMIKNRITQEPYAVGMKRNENDESLKKAVNITINKIQKDGTLIKLRKKWQVN